MNLAAAAQERLAEHVVNGSVTGSSDHDDDRRVFGALALHRSTEDGEDEVLPRLAVDHEESNEYISLSLSLSLSLSVSLCISLLLVAFHRLEWFSSVHSGFSCVSFVMIVTL